ncbi:MAG TPA: 2'-5' RNA ligase family protein [Marmoricola sp.]
MALAVCLLLDARTDRAVRRLWDRLEDAGIPTLRSHTHGRHLPHVSYAVLRSWDLEAVAKAVSALPEGGPVELHFDALGLFRRSRSWLVPAGPADLVSRQQAVLRAVEGTGADLHRHYRPGLWVPHCTLAPRVRMDQLTDLAALVYDVLPLHAVADRAALVDSGTGRRVPLPHVP